MGEVLSKTDYDVLKFLASCVGSGFTSGTIARQVGRGRDRIEMAGFRSAVMMKLYRARLVDKMDAETPAVFVITPAGRTALSRNGEHQ